MKYTAMLMAGQEGGCIRHSHIECRNEPDAGDIGGGHRPLVPVPL